MAGEVISMGEGMALSLRRFAEEFGVSRDLIKARMQAAGVTPAGEKNGHLVYRIRDVAPLLAARSFLNASGEVDPNRMPSAQRRTWYQSEQDRIELEVRAGRLLPVNQCAAELARLVKRFVQFCDTLPDVLERDIGLSSEGVVRAQAAIDGLRERLYLAAISPELDPDLLSQQALEQSV